jgi:hypothetical protein
MKPIAKIIKVRDFEAGIVGLETAMQNVYRADIKDKEQAKTELLRFVKDFGNYISAGMEGDYKDALWREYLKFTVRIEQGAHREDSGRL